MNHLQPSVVASPEERVILIHGTFAADASDSGDKWWQANSRAAQQLQEYLPKHVRVAEEREVFHWSGENGERARSKAAFQLLDHLRSLDENGERYHLVGHSHGGSVIWNALRLTTLARKPLKGLASWTTVGTPFLHHRGRSPWNAMNLIGVVLGMLLLRPAFLAVQTLLLLLWKAASGQRAAIVLRGDAEAGYTSVVRAPFLQLAERIGIRVERTPEGIFVGGYDPSGNQSLFEYLFATPEGLAVLCITAVAIYLMLYVAMMCIRPLIESVHVYLEFCLQQRAFANYGSSWLGIWSPDDEAINGLRTTLNLSMTFIRKIAPSDRVFITDNLYVISRPLFWLLAPIFNRVCRPAINALVRGILIRSAQGNDRPATEVINVLPSPVLEAKDVPPIPENLQAKILKDADLHLSKASPMFRRLLGSPSFTNSLESLGEQLSGREMVHTSYFDHEEILCLISFNVINPNGDELVASLTPRNLALLHWFQAFKGSLPPSKDSPEVDSQVSLPRPTSQRKAG